MEFRVQAIDEGIVRLRRSETFAPSMLERQMIHPVTLVPMSAPRMTEIACLNFIMPELTKPTTITDVAEDDWMTPVTPAPSSSPRRGVLDRR